jgi:hypothetical protein
MALMVMDVAKRWKSGALTWKKKKEKNKNRLKVKVYAIGLFLFCRSKTL